MHTYLMTRGTARSSDYRFLGSAPRANWWLELGDRVILEEPEVIVARRGSRTNALISGIPSDRRDVIGTAVRYTIVVDDLDEADAGLLVKIATIGTDAEARRALGQQLDKRIGADAVDAVYAGTASGADFPGLTLEALRDVTIEEVTLADTDHVDESWVGPADDAASRKAFLGRVHGLASGGPGTAFTSHSLSSRTGAEQAQRVLPGDVFVLIADGPVEELTRLGNSRTPPAETDAPNVGRLVLVASVALLGLAGLAIVWWIVRRLT